MSATTVHMESYDAFRDFLDGLQTRHRAAADEIAGLGKEYHEGLEALGGAVAGGHPQHKDGIIYVSHDESETSFFKEGGK
jgi:hypothetical protein